MAGGEFVYQGPPLEYEDPTVDGVREERLTSASNRNYSEAHTFYKWAEQGVGPFAVRQVAKSVNYEPVRMNDGIDNDYVEAAD